MPMPSITYTQSNRYSSDFVVDRQRTQKAEEIIRLTFTGMSRGNVAKAIGCSPIHVTSVVTSDGGKRLLQDLNRKAEKRLLEIQGEMIGIMEEFVELPRQILGDESVSPSIKSKVYFSLADRIGLAPARKVQPFQDNPITMDDIAALHRRMAEADGAEVVDFVEV